jgi:hypothetical protein
MWDERKKRKEEKEKREGLPFTPDLTHIAL